MSKILRYYAVLSFVAVLSAVFLLEWHYRQVAVVGITQMIERSNLSLTRAVLGPIRAPLLGYLQAAQDIRPGGGGYPPLPPEVLDSVNALMQDRTLVRIKIYNRHGVVAFSTKSSQIGTEQRDNPGVVSALEGQPASQLIYRDAFNFFHEDVSDANLVQTYIPIRRSRAEPASGVLELSADVGGHVIHTERSAFLVLIGAFLIMASLHGIMIYVLRRASRLIDQEQRMVRERTETLRMLSAQMLQSEEQYRRNIAIELQEDLAQSLAAIKLQMENVGRGQAGDVDTLIPVLQEAIVKARKMATGLRPSSLDDFGLLPTLEGLFREFSQLHPRIRFEPGIGLQERDIPAALKLVLYRIIVSALEYMARDSAARQIRLALGMKDKTLSLLVSDNENESAEESVPVGLGLRARHGLERMEALVALSGGEFNALQAGGGIILRAAWKL